MTKLKLDWKKVVKGDEVKLTYYAAVCPKCGVEIRVHQLGQRKFAEGLHNLNCSNDTK